MNQRWGKGSAVGERSGVTISREFDFPRESVFRMFTDAKKAAKFWGPEGAETLLFEVDPRPGGGLTIHGRNSDGITYKTSGTFSEVVVPERLVFTSATAPMGGTAPWEARQTMVFEELTPKRTRVTVHVKVLATGVFPGGVESLEQGFHGGWGETFDRLERELR
jgi:uncharacterized protein YndB with AHSA1/START domain